MKGKPKGRTTPYRLSLAEKKEEALRLRKAGLTYRLIGEELGVTEQRAWQIVTGELKRINENRSELAEGLLRLELERLDTLWKKTYDIAMDGNIPAASVCLKISERRSKMLGIDAPEKIAPTDPTGKKEFGKGVSNEDLELFIRREREKEDKRVKEEVKRVKEEVKIRKKDGSFSRN